MIIFRWILIVVLLAFCSPWACQAANPIMQFSSRSSKIILGDPSADSPAGYFQTTNPANFSGWGLDSIILNEKNCGGYGDTTSANIVHSWVYSTTYGSRDLIVATSNAVNVGGGSGGGGSSFASATSNWINTFMHTTSNALIYANEAVRTTSNWVNANGVLVRTASNALSAFVGATGATSAINAGQLVKQTSNWVNVNGAVVRTTSNWVQANAAVLSGLETADHVLLRVTSNWVAQWSCASLDIAPSSTRTVNLPGTVGRIAFENSGSTLVLANDLHLTGSSAPQQAVIYGSGFINGNNYVLQMNRSFYLDNQTITAIGNSGAMMTIDGGGSTLYMTNNSQFRIGSRITLYLRNMTLDMSQNESSQPFWFAANAYGVKLENVRLILPANGTVYFANSTIPGVPTNSGDLIVTGEVTFEGVGSTFVYNSMSTLEIESGSTLRFDLDTTFTLNSGSGNGDGNAIIMADATSTLHLNQVTLGVPTNTGLQLKKGRLVLENQVTIDNGNNTNNDKALILGDGSSLSNDVQVDVLGNAYLIVNGLMYFNNV